MRLSEIVQELQNRDSIEELTEKRFACANCGRTWIELVGLVVGRKGGNEDLCLRIGLESESCQVCRMKTRICQDCGSKDVYELRFLKQVSESAMNYRNIKTISKGQ